MTLAIGLATREEIAETLFEWVTPYEISPGVPAFITRSRKLRLWSEVPLELRPAIFLVERVQHYESGQSGLMKRTYSWMFFIYTDAKSATDENPGSKILNPLVEIVQDLLKASPLTGGKQTLGGVVENCYIEGELFFDPGDIDGDGMAIIPVKTIVP